MSKIQKQDPKTNTLQASMQAGSSSSVLKNALRMAFGTLTSRILGLLREILFAQLYDKSITDAFSAAFKIPNLFRRLFGEGSLSVSFIPVFIEALHDKSDHVRAQNLINALYSVILIFLSAITVLGVLYPDPLLHLILDENYLAQTDKFLLTRSMTQIMFGFVFFITSFAFFMGILNSLGLFFWPALAPTFFNISMVISTLWPKSWSSPEALQKAEHLAYGVLIGGVLQALILIPGLVKAGYFPRLTFKLKNKDLLKVLKNMAPGLVGLGLLQFTTIINLGFSSSLAEGTISYINYVDRLVELPLSLISVSLGTALLPALSSLWVSQKKTEMAEKARSFLQLNLFISLLAASGLFVLAQPIISLLFERGRFNSADVEATALILKTYCWIMVFSSGVRVLTPAYFAVKNTWFPAVASALGLILHVFLAPILIQKFSVVGLMSSTILSAAVNFLSLLFFYQIMISKFEYRKFLINVVKSLFSAVALGLTAQTYFVLEKSIHQKLALALTLLLCAVTFIALLFLTYKMEAQQILNNFKKRFSKI